MRTIARSTSGNAQNLIFVVLEILWLRPKVSVLVPEVEWWDLRWRRTTDFMAEKVEGSAKGVIGDAGGALTVLWWIFIFLYLFFFVEGLWCHVHLCTLLSWHCFVKLLLKRRGAFASQFYLKKKKQCINRV